MRSFSSHLFRILSIFVLASVLLTASANAQSPTPSLGASIDVAGETAVHPTIGNPAAVHCRDMGYKYETIDDDGHRGICTLPDGGVCDAWEFLQGKCGQSYSYCAQQGYEIKTVSDGKNPFSPEYAVCVASKGAVIGPVTELSELREKATGCGGTAGGEMPATLEKGDEYVPPPVGDPPASFDWRNYQGYDWMTPIKDQAWCGSCWAFSVVGVAEAAHNIANHNPNLDKDLSEQYLVSDCSSSGSCCGGWPANALEYIRDSGIPDEACMPYVDGSGCLCDGGTCYSSCTYNTESSCSDRTCSDRCGDWSSRLEYIGSTGHVSTDARTIKQALVDTGPLAVAMGVLSDYGGYWDGDIYRCTNDSGINHAVGIVGYDDAGEYWLVRNSWGTGWKDNGYFKLGYGECSVDRYVYYADVWLLGIDPYEPDDTSSQANWIYDESPQPHSIVPANDVDWIKFSLSTESEVLLETFGASGDTRMWLYDSSLNQLEYDDDDGSSLFSRIDRFCGVDALPAGTYYVKIDEHGNNHEISSYNIVSRVRQACATNVGPLVYDGQFVDDDTSGQSIGDGDGIADCGETIELYVDLLNQGSDTATSVNAAISTSDPYVNWLYNTDSRYSDISGGGTGTNSNDYDFALDASAPDGHIIHFNLDITAHDIGPWSDSFDVPVVCSDPCYSLTRNHTGSGSDPTATPGNSTGCSAGQYHAGESIQLSASPASGWQVTSWNGTDDDSSTATSNSLTMPPSDHTVTVTYTPCNSLATSVDPSGSGTIDVSPAPNCGTQYSDGTEVTLSAIATSGYTFTTWTGDAGGTANPTIVTMYSNKSVTANFTLITYSMSGLVTDKAGSGIAGVTVIASGASGLSVSSTATAVTDSAGYYTLTVETTGTYLLTFSKTGYIFGPVTVTVSESNPNPTADAPPVSQPASPAWGVYLPTILRQ